ncbi:MAG: hypothetical protein ACTSPB_18365 [Candidatus Thorarchaeota archaeon]
MRYFARQVRAVRIDGFRFGKNKWFEVSYERAKYLYELSGKENEESEERVIRLFERGQFTNVHHMGLLIEGREWNDSELFKQRLEGNIEQKVWK